MGVCYAVGDGVEKDPKRAVEWFRKAGQQGNADDNATLRPLSTENEVECDTKLVVERLCKSALRTSGSSISLGSCYDGVEVPKDMIMAVQWCRWAAEEEELPEAEVRLADCYLKGNGVAKDAKLAVHWLRKAAEHGNADAQFGLGFVLCNWY